MKTSEVLRAARAKIEAPERWTKHTFAKTADGRAAPSISTDAVCWCGYGAINYVGWGLKHILMDAGFAINAAVGGYFPDWQDAPERTHAEVLAAFDRAIAEREAVGD